MRTKKRDLSLLIGKKIGCTCKKLRNCHGFWLLELMDDLICERFWSGVVPFERAVVFGSNNCPLSNSYASPLHYGGEVFFSAEHLYSWLKASAIGEKYIAKHLVTRCNSLHDVDKYSKGLRYSSKSRPLSAAIIDLYNILKIKWDQCSDFRELCLRYDDSLLIQASGHKFWGCGINFNSIVDKNPKWLQPDNLTGQNIMGWLTKILTLEKVQHCRWPFDVTKLSFSLRCGYALCKKTLADAGLLSDFTNKVLQVEEESWQTKEGRGRKKKRALTLRRL